MTNLRLHIIAVLFVCACTGPSTSVDVSAYQMAFHTTTAYFGPATVVDGSGSETNTLLTLSNFDSCADLNPYGPDSTPLAAAAFEITVEFDFAPLPAVGSADASVTTPGDFSIGSTIVAQPAGAEWQVFGTNINTHAGDFTGGTISLTTVTASEMSGDLEITSPDGDYAIGSFSAERCDGFPMS